MKHATNFLLAVVCSSGLVWAQDEPAPRPGPGPKARAAIEFLDLSEAQLDSLRQIRRECRESLRPQAQRARELKKTVRAEMRKENPDPGLVGQYAVDGKSLRNEIKSARAGCKSEAAAVLTPEQAAQLEELEESLKHARVARQAAAMGLIDGPAGRRGGCRLGRNRRPRALWIWERYFQTKTPGVAPMPPASSFLGCDGCRGARSANGGFGMANGDFGDRGAVGG